MVLPKEGLFGGGRVIITTPVNWGGGDGDSSESICLLLSDMKKIEFWLKIRRVIERWMMMMMMYKKKKKQGWYKHKQWDWIQLKDLVLSLTESQRNKMRRNFQSVVKRF